MQASVTCDGCATEFSRFTWPMTASLGTGDDSVTIPIPVARASCPGCGRTIELEPADPL